jgi:hypothetical protein
VFSGEEKAILGSLRGLDEGEGSGPPCQKEGLVIVEFWGEAAPQLVPAGANAWGAHGAKQKGWAIAPTGIGFAAMPSSSVNKVCCDGQGGDTGSGQRECLTACLDYQQWI